MNELLLVDLNNANELFYRLLGVASDLLDDGRREDVKALVSLGVFVLVLDIAVIDFIHLLDVDSLRVVHLAY